MSDEHILAAMENAEAVGLGLPAVKPSVACLIVAPEEALTPDAKCPSSQCRVTDNYICKAYDTAARIGRLGNTLSHLPLALSTSLQAFAFQTKEMGRLMSTLVQACRHVWLAQSPLLEATRKVLRQVPAEPGELFGSTALETLDWTSLHRRVPTSGSQREPEVGTAICAR